MYYFVNDYSDFCSPEMFESLRILLSEKNLGYGFDRHSENARRLIKKAVDCDNCDVHFVPGGTSANILAVTASLRPEESVIAAATGHIHIHEAGAIEACGKKVELIETPDGKLTSELLKEKLKEFGREYRTVPRMVYISNTTEVGTVYNIDELKFIYETCRENNLLLYIDGARLAAAIASEKTRITLRDMPRVCDIFSIGGTKAGFALGEAIVIVNDEMKRGFMSLQKRQGAMLSKSFVVAAMYEYAFEVPERYTQGSIHAYKMGKRLAEGIMSKGIELYQEYQSNQIFVVRNLKQIEDLNRYVEFEIFDSIDDDNKIVRFVTNYQTTKEDVDGLIKYI